MTIVNLNGEAITDADEFPASKAVHWPSGVVFACDYHATGIVKLGEVLGSHIPVSYAPPGSQCSNCINESKSHPRMQTTLSQKEEG